MSIEYITIEKRIYDSMKFRLHNFERTDKPIEDLLTRVRKEEGFIIFKSSLKDHIGFISTESLKDRLVELNNLTNNYERLPRFLLYIVDKIWKK